MTDIYKYAARNKLLFPSARGDLTVEQLFDVPLTSRSGFDLDSIAKYVASDLKNVSEGSFVSNNTNPRVKPLEMSLEILKDVIATKQEVAAALLARQHKADERRKILDAISNKKDEALSASSIEELESKLAALEDAE